MYLVIFSVVILSVIIISSLVTLYYCKKKKCDFYDLPVGVAAVHILGNIIAWALFLSVFLMRFVKYPLDVKEFERVRTIIELDYNNELVYEGITANMSLIKAQSKYLTYGNWSIIPESIMDIEPIEYKKLE